MPRRLQTQIRKELLIREIGLVVGERKEGKLAQLYGLSCIQSGQVRGGFVVGVCSIAEDFQEREVFGVVCRAGESLNIRCLQKLREDEGIWGSSCTFDEVSCCAGRVGGFRER